jgi:hypothetical protein
VLSGVELVFSTSVKQTAFITHHPVNPLVIDPVMSFQSQTSPDASGTIGSAVLDHVGNGLFDDNVIAARRRLSQVCPSGWSISYGQLAANHRKGSTRLVGLFDYFKLLLWIPAPATLNECHHFHPSRRYFI